MNEIASYFASLDPIELVATVLGVAAVVLTVRRNIWCWPIGIVMVTIYVWVFWKARLYLDMGLHVVYIFMQIYGWWAWTRQDTRGEVELRVERLRPRAVGAWIAAGAIGAIGLGFLVERVTSDASLPYWDGVTTSFSLVAQYLMAKKIVESWLFWIFVDVIAVGVYWYKELVPTAALYFIYLGLATAGWLAWRRAS